MLVGWLLRGEEGSTREDELLAVGGAKGHDLVDVLVFVAGEDGEGGFVHRGLV